MKILTVLGEHNYGDPRRSQGYEYTNFLPALRALGHELAFFESFHRGRYADFAELNRALLLAVEREQPQIILFVLMGYEVWLETLETLRRAGKTLVNWGTDDSWKYDSFARFVAPEFDVYVTTSKRALERAQREGLTNVVASQWAANAATLAPPLPADRCRHKVTFIGSAYGARPRWIAALARRGIEVECFGHGWPAGPVAAADIPRIVRESVVSLNFADAGPHGLGFHAIGERQIKARTFEVPGAGGFLLTENVHGLADYYEPGEEVAVFEGIDDVAAQIRYLLAHPDARDRIALAGHRRTAREHTYEHRFREILSEAGARAAGRQPCPPFRFDAAAFAPLARAHATGRLLGTLRACLSVPCRLIWGGQRGPRAARRLLFELSWRVVGARTYRACGLPGRLFYAQS